MENRFLKTVWDNFKIWGSGSHECVEVDCKDRVYSIVFASIEKADYVNLYARDVTEAKRGERELIRANELLREHDRLKSEFVSTVSHELRTPLCIFKNILSNAMAGVMGKVSGKLYESLKTADANVDRLSRIVSNFLTSQRSKRAIGAETDHSGCAGGGGGRRCLDGNARRRISR